MRPRSGPRATSPAQPAIQIWRQGVANTKGAARRAPGENYLADPTWRSSDDAGDEPTTPTDDARRYGLLRSAGNRFEFYERNAHPGDIQETHHDGTLQEHVHDGTQPPLLSVLMHD